ncbi:MAG: LytR/AlgR family response regulator transcription factor [Phaeodactylibacter xiamenensis]|uniref:Chemotaxis protein CheY n=1 Tax=Phaeodactylibacter xiamenensis TaxID=1524460 RepID=A0A098RZ92_9BACT|nr:LytTR family DNA-binding domain-containing protein [Phaeodactylibacter xiamenensis]KGE85220.1 chemotaxis protein CheY [Phaeodactylibacter xiamenensis]
MLRCVIVDDEPLAIQLLSDYVRKTPDLELAEAFSNPIEALQYLQGQTDLLLFLDVQMPELTGIQVMKILNQRLPVILTTAYEQYALQGYEHNVVDYLMKPISYDRFYQAVQKVEIGDRRPTSEVQDAELNASYLFVKTEYRLQRVDYADIAYLEGQGDYVAIHTPAGRIMTLENMKHFEEVLPTALFVRTHRSYIVSIPKIDYIERNRVVIGKERLPISEGYRKGVMGRLKG